MEDFDAILLEPLMDDFFHSEAIKHMDGKSGDMKKKSPLVVIPETTDEIYAICAVQAITSKSGRPKLQLATRSSLIIDEILTQRISTPSYLRPTETFKARIEKEAVKTKSAAASIKASASKTLLAPTAASLSRIVAIKERASNASSLTPYKAASAVFFNDLLKHNIDKPQGSRVTDLKPFNLKSEKRDRGTTVLSSEEQTILKAQEEAKKYTPRKMPDYVKESRPIDPHVASTPKSPVEIVKPFDLRSLDRHLKAQEEIRKKNETEAREKEQIRLFKAQDWSKEKALSPVMPVKPEPAPVTTVAAFTHHAALRAMHRESLVRESLKDLVEEKQEEPEISIAEYRKGLEFHARHMPSFEDPFTVDPSKARSPTTPQAFNFRTDARLGKSVSLSARGASSIQVESLGTTRGYLDGDGYVNAFAASLRSPTGATLSEKVKGKKSAGWRSSCLRSTSRSLSSVSFLV